MYLLRDGVIGHTSALPYHHVVGTHRLVLTGDKGHGSEVLARVAGQLRRGETNHACEIERDILTTADTGRVRGG